MTRFAGCARLGRRGRSRRLITVAAVATVALVLAACGGGGGGSGYGSTQAPTAKGRQGDVYRAPQVQQGPGVTIAADTPYTSYNGATADGHNLYNLYVLSQTLAEATWVDANQDVLVNGDVMDGIDLVSSNPQVVRWRIKPGITWSDGAPWNCKDFYLAYLASSGKIPGFTTAGTNGYANMSQAGCTDGLTFQATFNPTYGDYKGLFSQNTTDLLPAHVLEAGTGVPDIRRITPQSPPDVLARVVQFWNTRWNGFDRSLDVASGPYMLDNLVLNQSATLVRNPRWKGAPGGPQSITYRAVPDATAEAQALQNGELQVAVPQVDVNAASLLRGLSAQGVKFAATPSASFEHLDMNVKNPLFADKTVRTAFAQMINRQEIVDKLVKGVQPDAAPLGSLSYLPTQRGYEDNYSTLMTSNAQQASQTLQRDGWVRGPDGIFAKNGQRLQFRISHTDVPRRVQTVQLLQAQAQAAGMQIVDDTDPNFLDQRVSKGDYDVALFAWVGSPFNSEKQSIYSTGGGQNWQGYSNPQVDATIKSAVSDLDPAGSIRDWQRVDTMMAADVVSLPLYVQPNMIGYTDRIDSAYYQPNIGPTYNTNEWVVAPQ